MIFIDEKTIDKAIDLVLDGDDHDEALYNSLLEQQPNVLAYILNDEESAFTEEEKDYLFHLLLIIWQAISSKTEVGPVIEPQTLADAEEVNWDKLETQQATKFRERIAVFFEETDQEDLLAFIEDAVLDDEESPVSKEGREPMFVLLKSVVDCFASA
jgi:hypothetical protein